MQGSGVTPPVKFSMKVRCLSSVASHQLSEKIIVNNIALVKKSHKVMSFLYFYRQI